MSDKQREEKDSLLELIKKLWLPISGFLGAVTLAYNFYQLWLGDQTTITYITGGAGLLVLIIALVWVGFRNKTVEVDTIIQHANQTETKRKIINPAYRPRYRNLARIGLVLVLVGIVWSGFALAQRRQAVQAAQQFQSTQLVQATQTADMAAQIQSTQKAVEIQQAAQTQQVQATQYAQATQQMQQELEDKLVVVIAAFDGPEEVYGLRNEIIEKLNTEFSSDSEIEIATIADVITPDMGSAYARALGEQHFADLVVWGWYRPTENPNITLHIENLSPMNIKTLQESEIYQPQVTLADLESFEIQKKLGAETSTLISFLSGVLRFKSGAYQTAIERFEQLLQMDEVATLVSRYDLFFYLGSSNYELGDYKKSAQYFDKAIEINPQSALAYNNRGIAYSKLQQINLALQDYNKAIEINPQFSFAYNNRGLVYGELKQHNLAIQDFDEAIKLDPNLMLAYYNRGLTYGADLEQFDKAIDNFSKAIELDPNYAYAYIGRGKSYYYLKDYESSTQDFNKAIEINPQSDLAYANRGGVYDALQQYENAIQDYSRAIEINSRYIEAYHNRGIAYYRLTQYEKAINDFEKALEINPQYAGAYHNRGITYATLAQYDQAISDFSKAIQLDTQRADSYYGRGLVYQWLGKPAEAEADFAKYKELTGKDAP